MYSVCVKCHTLNIQKEAVLYELCAVIVIKNLLPTVKERNYFMPNVSYFIIFLLCDYLKDLQEGYCNIVVGRKWRRVMFRNECTFFLTRVLEILRGR